MLAADDGEAEAPAGSKKGSMFNLFKKSSSKEIGKGDAVCSGSLHYRTVVKSMFGTSKTVWKKRKMELVPSSSDDVGPVLRCVEINHWFGTSPPNFEIL